MIDIVKQWVSTRDDFSPRKHLSMSRDIVLVVTVGEKVLSAAAGHRPLTVLITLQGTGWLPHNKKLSGPKC